MSLNVTLYTEEDKEFRNNLVVFLRKNCNPDTSERALALAAQVVGGLLAMQDKRTMTMEMARTLVEENIILGNQQARENMKNMFGKPN